MDSEQRIRQLEDDLKNSREMISYLSGILQAMPKLGGKDEETHKKLNILLENQETHRGIEVKVDKLTEDLKGVNVNNSDEMLKVVDTVQTIVGYSELFVNDFQKIHDNMHTLNAEFERMKNKNEDDFNRSETRMLNLETNFQKLAGCETLARELMEKVENLDTKISEVQESMRANFEPQLGNTEDEEPVPTLNSVNGVPPSFLDKIQPMTTILLLGETGVGKSTFINALVNYLKYGTLDKAQRNGVEILIKTYFTHTDDDYNRVEIVGEPTIRLERGYADNENTTFGMNATQHPKSYIFSWGAPNNRKSVRIIDTPGICDVRGVQQDKENFQYIMNFIADFKEINAICILLKPYEGKLTLTFRFCINELLAHLHVSASKNILFCFTNARQTNYLPGETLTTLRAHLDNLYKKKGIQIELDNKTMFCFDNEAFRFLCALRQDATFTSKDIAGFSVSWTKAVESTFQLLSRISELTPHDVENTLCVNNIRAVIPTLARPLAELARNQFVNINLTNDKIKEINEAINNRKDLEGRLYFEQVRLGQRGMELVEVIEKTLDPTVEKSIITKQKDIETASLFIDQMRQRNEDLHRDVRKITQSSKTFAAFLNKHSLLPVHDSFVDYVDHLILEEMEKIRNGGSDKVLKQLQAYKAEYAAYQSAIGSADDDDVTGCDKSIEEIYEMVNDLKKMANVETLAEIQKLEMLSVRKKPQHRETTVNLSF